MSTQATAVWEMRPATGNNLNGGGFDAGIAGAGTDYSQQDSPQLALTDIACVQNSTTVTSVVGGFTAAMVGNALHNTSGTNILVDWVWITGYTDTHTITVDKTIASAGAGSAGVGKIGGALAFPTTAFGAKTVSGNTVWYKIGTGTLTDAPTFTGSSGVNLIGYNTTRGDEPVGANRPTLICGTYVVSMPYHSVVRNIIFTSGAADTLYVNAPGEVINCKFTRTGAGSKVSVCSTGNANGLSVEDCEIIGPGSAGTGIGTNVCKVKNCIIKGHASGISTAGAESIMIQGTIVAGNTVGLVNNSSANNLDISSCTFYNNGTHIQNSGATRLKLRNTIISVGTYGLWKSGAPALEGCQSDYCCWNCTTDIYNGNAKGKYDITGDPLMVDPANGDYTLQIGSPCIGAGAGPGTKIGLAKSFSWNIGADQSDHVPLSGQTWGVY